MSSLDPVSETPESQPHNYGETNGQENGHAANGALTTLEPRLPAVPALNWSYGPPPRPEILSAKPNPVELLHAVRRRWPWAVGLSVIIAGIASGLLWYFIPVKYEAYALLKVSGRQQHVLAPVVSATDEFMVFKRTQVQLLMSHMVMNGTLRDRSINQLSMVRENSENPTGWLKKQLVIDYPDDAEIMRVAMRGTQRNEVVKIVDKVVEVYLKEIVQTEKQRRIENESKLKDSYGSLSAEYEKELSALRTLENVHKTSGSEAAQMKKKLAIEELNGMMADRKRLSELLAANDLEITMLEDKTAEGTPAMKADDVIVDMELARDPQISELTKKIAEIDAMIGASRAAAANPRNVTHLNTLQVTKQQYEESIEERKATMRPKIEKYLSLMSGGKDSSGHTLSLPSLKKQRDYLTAKMEQASKDIDAKSQDVAEMESFSAQVAAKQESLAALRAIKTQLGAELDRIRVERLAPERITLVDKAILADSHGDAVRKYIAVAFAAILSVSLVVLGVAFVEFQARKINSVKEVNDGLGVRVVGELPNIGGRAFRRLRGGKGPAVLKALMAERIDATRTALIHTTAIDPPRVVMVTSAEPHEGKTTTSSQLAASLARSGRRTLLIDADIRSPGVHRVFEMAQDPGLSELLRGEAERDGVIHPTRTANLWLMPAGRCDLRSVQALSSSFLGTTIAALSVQFDYIIIDSGPVLKVADPLLVGQHVDAAIVSVLRDRSKVPNVYEAVERLRSVGITVLGSVVNGVKDDVARHGVELLMAETPQANQAETTTA